MKSSNSISKLEAVKTLDQESLHQLLEGKLKFCPIVQNDIKRQPINLETNVKSLKIKDFLKESCMSDVISCPGTKQSLDKNFRECLKLFQKDSNRNFPYNTMRNQTSDVPKLNQSEPTKTTENKFVGFLTAKEQLAAQNLSNGSSNKRTLGSANRGVRRKFVSPLLSTEKSETTIEEYPKLYSDENLKHIDPKMIDLIKSEIMDTCSLIDWNDIAGLQFAKSAIQEAVIWPMLRPDIFTGLRRPPKGILLFGPPGTGKTLLGKCIASQSKSTFFSISASSLTSKWIGDGEKMVRALFAVARTHQPAVIFIDEIDSLLTQRSDTEHESSRRIKTEFLVQLDGASTTNEERLLLVGATNRPQELDEAARRRFVKRLYIPLPDYGARLELLKKLVSNENHSLNEDNFKEIANLSEGYSGADLRSLCSEASLEPIRSISIHLIEKIRPNEVRPLLMNDFKKAFLRVKSSVSSKDLDQYIQWDQTFGCGF